MKLDKLKIISILACIALPAAVQAQDYEYEVAISWGGYPAIYGLAFSDGDAGPEYIMSMSHMFSDYEGPLYTAALFNAEFNIIRKKWLTSSISLGNACFWRPVYDRIKGGRDGHNVGIMLSLMHTWRFTYVNKPAWRMYSGVGIGLCAGAELQGGIEDAGILPLAQVVPVGLAVGRRVYGFFETGFGLEYIGGRFGIGYRF